MVVEERKFGVLDYGDRYVCNKSPRLAVLICLQSDNHCLYSCHLYFLYLAAMGNRFPLFQKNYWYEYSTPPSTVYPGNVKLTTLKNIP